MQIPYEVQARPDTGLYNAKLGIWLFLASEVMLFGGLFSAYIFLRAGAEPGYWPHGLLNVPVGAFNTVVLIASSVTVVLSWASLKMRNFKAYKLWMGITILCGFLFLGVKLAYEWPQKYVHFGAFIKKESMEKYEKYLNNEHLKAKKLDPRVEISGHLHEVVLNAEGANKELLEKFLKAHHLEMKPDHEEHGLSEVGPEDKDHDLTPGMAQDLERIPGIKFVAFKIGLDPIYAKTLANPHDETADRPHFKFEGPTTEPGRIEREDVETYSAFVPRHSPYFAVYFTITGLHGLHVLAGVLIMCYFWLPIEGGANMFKRNPEHLANRVEVVGLFWHFVDLIWIFVFPLFYLL